MYVDIISSSLDCLVLLMPRQLLLLVLLVFNVSSRPKKSIRPRNQNMIFLPSSFQLYVSACVNFPLSKINPSRKSSIDRYNLDPSSPINLLLLSPTKIPIVVN